MAFMDFLFGKGEKQTQYPRFTQNQEGLLNQLISGGTGGQGSIGNLQDFLGSLLDPQGFDTEALEKQGMRQFQERVVPSIAERFNSSFGPESLNTEAFARALGSAGAGLSENLAVRGAELGQQGRSQGLQASSLLQGLLGLGLQPSFETGIRGPQQGIFQQGLSMLPYLALLGR